MKRVSLLFLLLLVTGCGFVPTAQLVTLREGMDHGSSTVWKEHIDWAQKLHDGTPLSKLSDADLAVRKQAQADYNALVTSSRNQNK